MKRLLWIVGLCLLVAAGIAYYVRVDVSAAPTQLTFDAVSRGDVVATVEATGTLQPLDTVEVGTQVSGTIASIGHRLQPAGEARPGAGDARSGAASRRRSIKRKATVIRLHSDVERAQVQFEDALLKLKRAEQLAERQLLAQQDVDTARSTARVAETSLTGAQAQLTQAEAALTQAKVNLSHTVITAPTDGIVLSRDGGGRSNGVGRHAGADAVRHRARSQAPRAAGARRRIGCRRRGARRAGDVHGGCLSASPIHRHGAAGAAAAETVQNVVTYTTIIDVPNDDGQLKPGHDVDGVDRDGARGQHACACRQRRCDSRRPSRC